MRRLRFLVLFFWALLLLGLTLWRFPVPMKGALDLARSAAVATLLLLAALAHGRALLERFKLFHGSWLEEACYSLGLGLIVLSLVASALGAAGLLYDWLILCWLIGAFLVHWEHLESLADNFWRSLRSKQIWEGKGTEVLTLMALALSGLVVLALCLAPPSFYDALVYHLAQAQRAAVLGSSVPQPQVLFTWLPSLPTPLWSLALVLDGDPLLSAQAAGLLNMAVFGLLGLILLDAGSRLLSERRLWLAPALALTQPVLALSFGVFSPDGWMALYAFLSLNAFLLALSERGLRLQAGWLLLSALTAGAAVAAKPVALAHAAALLILVAALALREPGLRRLRWLLGGVALFLLPLLPWLLQGALRLGQPFYPFPLHLFHWQLGAGAPAAYFQHVQDFGGRDWLRLPYNLFFDPGSLGGGGHLGFLLLALCPAALAWRLSRELRWTGFYLLLGGLLWLAGPHVLRYALFMVPAASLLAAHGAIEAEAWTVSRTWTYLWRLLLLSGLLIGALQTLVIAEKSFSPFGVALGTEAPSRYLERQAVPQIRAAAWIGSHGGSEDSKVLLLGDSRSAWLPARTLAASVFEEHPLAAWVGQAQSPQQVGALLRRKGYDFVVLNRAEWARLRAEPPAPIYWPAGDAAAQQRFEAWIATLEALPSAQRYSDAGLLIARLR